MGNLIFAVVSKDISELKIGVLGGGQLGRMMIQSAINYNLDISMLDPDPNAPCAHLVENFQVGELTDEALVYQWGQAFDLITIEIENVSVAALRRLVNKLGKEGYDGRGVQILKKEEDLEKAFEKPGILELLIDFEKELSVITARNKRGEVSCFPVAELSYHPVQNLVEFLFAPAQIPVEIEKKAYDVAKDVIHKLDLIGLLAVEMFLTKDGEILVNEVAPRTHNSGHHTIEASLTSQFEQHLRAVLDMPLGAVDLITPAAMVNLLGEDKFTGNARYEGLEECLSMKGVYIHLYGKKLTKPFRKMGHVTITDDSIKSLKEKARRVKDTLKVKA